MQKLASFLLPTYLSLVASRLYQNSEVSNLMRDLMKEYCESSDYTKIATHKKRRTNGQSISEVMSEVCGKI